MELPGLTLLGSGTKKTNVSEYIGFAVPSFAILAALAIAYFVVWPKFQEVMQIKSSNKDLVALNATLSQKADALERLNKSELTSDYALADQMLPSDKEVFLLLRQIEVTATSNGVVLSSLTLTPGQVGTGSATAKANAPAPPPSNSAAAAGADVVEIPVTLSISSDYRSLISFLSNIFAEPRVVNINNISSAASGTGTVSTSISLTSYWQSLPTTLGSIDSPISNLTSQEIARLKKAENSPISVGTSLPQVPVGRSDLFSPF